MGALGTLSRQKQQPFSPNTFPNLKLALAIILALTLIGGWFRFRATSFGLPDKFRPDEKFMIRPALDFAADWNPHFAIYPAAQMYIQHAALWTWGVTHGDWRDFRSAYATDNQVLAYLVARRASAAMGMATIPALYFAAVPIFGPSAALATAAIATFCTLHMRDSKYATTDIGMVFWLTLAIAMIFRMILYGRRRDYLAAGVFSGLAIATKYPAGAIVFGVAVAHLEVQRCEGRSLWKFLADQRLYLAAAATITATFCFTPYTFLDWRQTLRDWTTNHSALYFLHGSGNPFAGYGWAWLMFRAMPDSFGIVLQVLFLIALLWGLVRRRRGTPSLLAFIAASLIGITSSHYVFYRYLLVPFPAIVLLGGVLIADAAGFAMHVGGRPAVMAIALGLGLILMPSIIRDIQLDRLLLQTDTRTLARQWIEAHIPRGSRIAFAGGMMPFGKPQLPYDYSLVPFCDPPTLRATHVRWVISDELPALRFYSPGPSEAELSMLDSEATLVFDVNPLKSGSAPIFDANDAFYAPIRHISSMTRPGPRIRIWELREASNDNSVPSHVSSAINSDIPFRQLKSVQRSESSCDGAW